jgi:hypothetical protein
MTIIFGKQKNISDLRRNLMFVPFFHHGQRERVPSCVTVSVRNHSNYADCFFWGFRAVRRLRHAV